MKNSEALMVLNAVKGLGGAGVRKLVEYYGSAAKTLSMTAGRLLSDRVIPEQVCRNIADFPKDDFLLSEFALMEKRNARVVTYLDSDYPRLLQETDGAPSVLYIKGELPSDPLPVAIVGSRKASYYGLANANKFALRLAELGFTVVSGMARGIDTESHRGALKAGGKTVAVLGCGLAHIYPPENKDLYEQIAVSGAVLSEFPMQTMPFAYNFPRRNRVISGLSLGVIVVEAAKRSGALITADFALEQGREVFAIPGQIDSLNAQGAHHLIKQGAKLVTGIEDILEDLMPKCEAYLSGDAAGAESRTPGFGNRLAADASFSLSDQEKIVFDQIADRPVHIDELTAKCGASVPVMSVLLQLELKKAVKQLPGKIFTQQRKM